MLTSTKLSTGLEGRIETTHVQEIFNLQVTVSLDTSRTLRLRLRLRSARTRSTRPSASLRENDILISGSPVFNGKVVPAVALLAGGSATAAISSALRQNPESLISLIENA